MTLIYARQHLNAQGRLRNVDTCGCSETPWPPSDDSNITCFHEARSHQPDDAEAVKIQKRALQERNTKRHGLFEVAGLYGPRLSSMCLRVFPPDFVRP